MKVISTAWWHHGQGTLGGGLSSQVTKLEHDGVEFYVRENCTGIPSFYVSSSERMGDKVGKKPRSSRQVLELCCPPVLFDQLATLVHQYDTLQRPVQKNNSFTKLWAETILKH